MDPYKVQSVFCELEILHSEPSRKGAEGTQ